MSIHKEVIRVGISDLNIAEAPTTIRTSGLGSCVGVVIYDVQMKLAGLAHVMLPESIRSRQDEMNPYKYADTAIPILVDRLCEHGARLFALKAKLAGGSQMFSFESNSSMMRIGPRNVEAVREQLKEYRIPIIAEDIGGSSGRTIECDPATGELHIRTVNKGNRTI